MDEVLNIIKMILGWSPIKRLSLADISMPSIRKRINRKKTLSDFATGHLYFGLHRTEKDGHSVNGRPMPQKFI